MNIILITGASSGMGVEFALQLDNVFKNIDEIWLVARRKKEMLEVAQHLEHTTRVLDMDVTDDEQIKRLEKLLSDEKPMIRMLVNGAGYGIMGDFSASNIKDALGMIDVNCKASTQITHLCIPEKTGSTLAVKKLTLVRADQVVEKAIADSYHKRERSVYSAWIQSFEVLAKVLPHRVLLEVMRFLK